MISIVNYGMGNIGSIVNMFKKVGVKAEVVQSSEEILRATKLVLPGVGAFDAAMTKIEQMNIRAALDQKVLHEKIPILGICLGMQLLTKRSDEGVLPGLGWIDAQTLSFRKVIDTTKFKVPHMGWNNVSPLTASALTHGFNELDDVRFYFVHSFYVKCQSEKNSIFRAKYGISFDAAIQKENIYGAQFHPEKSHKFGMKLLKNFARLS